MLITKKDLHSKREVILHDDELRKIFDRIGNFPILKTIDLNEDYTEFINKFDVIIEIIYEVPKIPVKEKMLVILKDNKYRLIYN